MTLKIYAIDGGFYETFQSNKVKKIVCTYSGECKVYYYNGIISEFSVECSSFNRQYGFPISETFNLLFTSSWENGLAAYDMSSGICRWTCPVKKATALVVEKTYLILLISGSALLKIDILSGCIITEIKSKSLEHIYELQSPYILLDRFRGRLSVVNSATMQLVHSFTSKQINPRDCLCVVIQEAYMEKDTLWVCGFEDYANQDFANSNRKSFCRSLGKINLK